MKLTRKESLFRALSKTINIHLYNEQEQIDHFLLNNHIIRIELSFSNNINIKIQNFLNRIELLSH